MILSQKKIKIVIGTRGSDLALRQADIVSAAIRANNPSLIVEVRVVTTKGDLNQSSIPSDSVGKGWFTKEIEDELLKGNIDIAVHSLKDLGENMPEGLSIAAYLSREDARDVLIIKEGRSRDGKLIQGGVVGTDSPRRRLQLLTLRPDLIVKSLRGNVPTRLKKLDEVAYDAIVLAAAGLNRLGLEHKINYFFDQKEMTPAPGQGILAVQARDDDTYIKKILEDINNQEVAHIAHIERSFARATGGGCKSPTGAYAFKKDGNCYLLGMVAEQNGTRIIRGEISASWGKSDMIGEDLARMLLKKLNEIDNNKKNEF